LSNRASTARSEYYFTHEKANEQQKEQESKEVQALSLLRAGRGWYEVSEATGLDQARISKLDWQRRVDDGMSHNEALRERSEALRRTENFGPPSELARRIGRLRRGLDPEQEDEPEYPSGLHTLGDLNRAFRY
jgi:hypothetical protein